MSLILVDSYAETNSNSNIRLSSYYSPIKGQSITGKYGLLKSIVFYLSKTGTPTGNIIAKLYAHSGIFGTSSLLIGSALAISENIDVSTLTEINQLINFNFNDDYILQNLTYYCIELEYFGGDENNYIEVGIDTITLLHDGNYFSSGEDGWNSYDYYDLCFYVYAESDFHYAKSIAKPITLKTTKEINGAWTANMQILPDDYISAESYIDVEDEQYIAKNVKKIKSQGKTYFDVSLYHNMFELTDLTIDRFSLLKTPTYLLDYILTDCEWTAGDCDIDEIIYLRTDKRTTILEALNLLAERCGGELYFYSQDRTVDLKREIGTHTGLQIRYDKNSDYIEKEEDSSELITRIYPYGSDNFEINSTILDNCEDETDYTPSGAGSTEASDEKQQGAQAIKLISSTLNETFIHDLGAGNIKDLSGHDSLKFWVYSELDNANGFTFGISEGANPFTESMIVNTGALDKECWKEVELDLSGVADADKNAIRYIGFKNLTGSAVEVVVDSIRAFKGNIYIDSPNIAKYRVRKEYTYQHSAKPEKTQFEKLIYPSDDSWVGYPSPNANHGNEGNLYNYSNFQYSCLKFMLSEIPIGATIISAYLNLYYGSVTNFTVGNIYRITANWYEGTITYNNRPASVDTGVDISVAIGWRNVDIITLFTQWYNGTYSNYGIYHVGNAGEGKHAYINSKENASNKPYLKIVYTLTTDPSSVIIVGAMDYLFTHDEPKLKYKVNMVDLSKVMVNTWEDETIDLGDTVRVYDSELKINTNCRIKKITKNLLDPADVSLELVNKAYSIADLEAKRAKQLSYAMPFHDNPKIIDAGSIQAGYLGGDVQL